MNLRHLLLLLLSFCAVSAWSSSIPASMQELTITSHDSRMGGHAYLPKGEGPHPAVLLLHGYPGNEKNLDIAQAMRRAGYTVVFFHYRGAWGSEGEFGYENAEQDVLATLNFMRAPAMAKQLRINPDKISIVGHSMGGHMTLAGFSMDSRVSCAVALDNSNIGTFRIKQRSAASAPAEATTAYADSLFMLEGWSGKKALAELSTKHKRLDLLPRLKASHNQRPILFIPANSSVINMQQQIVPLYDMLKQQGNDNVKMIIIDDDHAYSSNRERLAATVIAFLDGSCR